MENQLELTNARNIIVVGAGQAGMQAVQSLRMGGYKGDLCLLGDEAALPYQRPPLSKAYMKGELDKERLFFKEVSWFHDNDVDLRVSISVTSIDRSAQTVEIEGAEHLPYDALILATGSRPRALPTEGANLHGVHDLRTLADVDKIRPDMKPGHSMAIIGAGYIGLEAAAVARQMGLNVTVIEMAPRVLARVTSPVMSEFYESEHTAQGVKILTNARLDKLTGKDGRVTAAHLADGSKIDADIVLVGIGILPNQELAEQAGIACDNGIIVDRDCRTSDPLVFAIGDCASRPLVHYGRTGRLESVHNALEQGKLAAAAILGKPRPPEDCPWFWSDQYDLKLQIAGLSQDYDELVLRGNPADRKFAVFYLLNGTLIAVDAVNSAPEFLASKKLIMNGVKVSPKALSDTSISMKEIATMAMA